MAPFHGRENGGDRWSTVIRSLLWLWKMLHLTYMTKIDPCGMPQKGSP